MWGRDILSENYSQRNNVMLCNIFISLPGGRKKGKPVMEGNCRLNIKIEGHIAELYCLTLFRYFKNTQSFLLNLISLSKNTFLPFCCWRKENLSFHKRGVDFANGIVLLAS